MDLQSQLSRRERQIMDIIYRRGRAFVWEVHQDIPNPPSYSAVRAMMRILEEKGYLRHEKAGNKYVYSSTQSRRDAGLSAAKGNAGQGSLPDHQLGQQAGFLEGDSG
ncbi:hypothetical protein LCGC14_2761630 [marine sediment metagenome]|uniref:BlaI/MecI/CopY family transcriptional regulator n=1 Tax=marine sediment metagenome TaxID=412755 RepID=A0A0F8YYR6_9ZZZZ